MGGWQDDHDEKDLEESQRGSGQDAPACRCPLKRELLGRHPRKQKRQFVLRQLTGMSARCRITTLELGCCAIAGPHAEWLAGGGRAQCRALVHLDLSDNKIGAAGAESLAGVLGQCAALVHLNLSNNQIGAGGAESLAGVLGQCTALAHLDLQYNGIKTVGEGRLRASWRGQASGLVFVEVLEEGGLEEDDDNEEV